MFKGASLNDFNKKNVAIWMTLAFQAGAINAGGFLACHRFVSHTTGFATQFGADFAQGHFLEALGMLSVPVFFMAGSMVSAFLVDRRQIQGHAPRYTTVLILMTLCSLSLVIAGNLGHFGHFGEQLVLTRDYLLLAILCFICGLQNAMITSASGAIVRTTHLTGLTTDLGIGLVRILFHERPQHRQQEIRSTWMRSGVIAFFVAGSTAAAYIHIQGQYWGFLIPTLISAVLWWATQQQYNNDPIKRRLEGARPQ